MGRETQEAVVLQSSIALLQQRFKELHRVKKEREERELLKMMMLPVPDHNHHNHNHEPLEFTSGTSPATLFSQHERAFLPPKPPLILSLSLWPYSQQIGKHGGHDDHLQVLEAEPTLFNKSLFSMEKVPTSWNKLDYFDMDHNDDVDTSLHL